jgi:superfamily II DNA or RNA helicase
MELKKYLVLNRYFLNLLGYNDFKEIQEKLREVPEGYNSREESYFVNALINENSKIDELELLNYDRIIKEYVEKLRRNREQHNFNLKYYQYLAVLFTEIFLDKYFNKKEEFLEELNNFLKKFNEENNTEISKFTDNDLKKLAYWMATGSGKTLILHINYWQILKYFKNWDNIILITPNEGLSKQHYKELEKSGIPCKLYNGNINDLKTKEGEILIIDIYKLTKEKKGEGVSVDISYFDGKNLVFIDEGHKGLGSNISEESWKFLRDELTKEGFIFEYSATFGQAIDNKNKYLLEEYAKSIIFDYSYYYFYNDGYGKDYFIYNINLKNYSERDKEILLTAGLLTLYEQLYIYENFKEEIKKYNIEKPLWVFVGGTVSKQSKTETTDILEVLKFLKKILEDQKYLENLINNVFNEGLKDEKGVNILENKFKMIKEKNIREIIKEINELVFNGGGSLVLREISNADGEIGLKGSFGEYFGVINVGNINELKKLIEDKLNIKVEKEEISNSLFEKINEKNSPITILIGSRKFSEGWDSWRVSVMGLMNMGKSKGPLTIQLFGRGVRLKGKNFSLKREENADYKIRTLQTLFIFGLNSSYLSKFLNDLKKEGIEIYDEIRIPIRFNNRKKWENRLYILDKKENLNFLDHPVKLVLDEEILKRTKIDLRNKIQIVESGENREIYNINEHVEIPKEYLNIVDWDNIYLKIIEFKMSKGMYNLIIEKEELRKIVESNYYKLFVSELNNIEVKSNKIVVNNFEGLRELQNKVILTILKTYIDKFYRIKERRFYFKKMKRYL